MKDALGLLFGIGVVALVIWLYAGDAIAARTGLPISRSNIADRVSSFGDTITEVANQPDRATSPGDTTTEVAAQPDPALRHLALKRQMLLLTNQEREKNGVPPVRLGTNPAAQLHAEAALEGCYGGHWDKWGLKPNHRYTLTGGTGAEGENGSGLRYCIKAQDNYRAITSMNEEIAEAVQGWMDSPGHRKNLLNPAHTVLNVGITHDRYNRAMVQHFSSDYVNYQVKPYIDSVGVLRLEARTERASLQISNSVNIQISYDPPAKTLTRGQLNNTYALCNGRQIAYLVEPLTDGSHYSGPSIKTKSQENKCLDPYQINPSRESPKSHDAAYQAWADAKAGSAAAAPITTQVARIAANRLDRSGQHINVEADLNQVLQQNGPGIYTVTLWGRPNHMLESSPLSKQAIFWQTPIPPGNPYIHHRQNEQVRAEEALLTAELARILNIEQQTQPRNPAPAASPRIATQVPAASPEITAARQVPATSPEIAAARRVPAAPAPPAIKLNTPAPAPWAITPTPLGTGITSINTPAPWPTQPPAPTQAPAATPTPTPTATPIPTKQTYTNQALGYSIDYPHGWVVSNEGPVTLIQDPQGMGNFVEIARYPVQKDQSLGDLADAYMAEMLLQAPQWTEFSPSWGGSDTNNSGLYWVLKFTRKKSPSDCAETGEAHIFRSKYVPKELVGYSLTMATCQQTGGQLSQEKSQFLNSFMEN